MLKIEITLETLSANVKGLMVEMEIKDIHQAGIEKVLTYGFQRYFNDACGGEKTAQEIIDITEKRKEGLKTGNVGRSGSGRKSLPNSVKAERIVMERYFLAKNVMKKGEVKKFLAEHTYESALAHLFNKIAEGVLKKPQSQFTVDEVAKVGAMITKNQGKIDQEVQEELAKMNKVDDFDVEDLDSFEL